MSLFRRSKSKSKPKDPPADCSRPAGRASSLKDGISNLSLTQPLATSSVNTSDSRRRPRSWGGSEMADMMNVAAFRNPYTAEQDTAVFLSPSVPPSFRACIHYLSQPDVLSEDGLFRVSGNAIEVGKLSRILDEHGFFNLIGFSDPATIVGLLKDRMRSEELPLKSNEAKLFEMTVITGRELGMDTTSRASSTRDSMVNLSPVSSCTLLAIIKLLGKVHRADNKMSYGTLGTSVGIQVFPGVTAKKTGELIEFLDTYSDDIWGNRLTKDASKTARNF